MNRKRALCVGINAYTSAPLSGCVNDANDWAEHLAREDYEVTILTDQAATKQGVLDALGQLVATAKFGDRIVFTYSGHGTWTVDEDGDEPDGRDEALCPIDYSTGGLILDDELQDVFAELAYGAAALTLSDSCHSGTVNRAMSLEPENAVRRFIPPHLISSVPVDEDTAIMMERELGVKPTRKTTSLISGCNDLEYSWDAWFNGRANGAFTRTAIDSHQPGMSLMSWFQEIRMRLPSANYSQSPQLTAANAYRKYLRAL